MITPQEIKSVRHRSGMSYREFAEAIQLNGKNAARTVRRFEGGSKLPSKATEQRILALDLQLIERMKSLART